MGNQVIVTANNTVQVSIEPTPQVQVTISRAAIGNISNVVVGNANYANFAGTAFSVSGSNVSGAVANANYALNAGNANFANSATIANTANIANVANVAYSVSGANVSGAVANANYALNAGNANFANSATIANTANSVTLANVSGAGNIASINLDGNASNVLFGNGTFGPEGSTGNANYANFAGNAFAVDGANVSGTVANATYAANAGNANFANNATTANTANIANIAYSVDGANVSGTVANATYAANAGNANFANSATTANTANSANSVTLANVSGAGNIAGINLDGNVSNLLTGNGTFVAIPTVSANANYANFAGQVIDATQSNITTVGTLTDANISNTGSLRLGNIILNQTGNTFSGVLNELSIIPNVANANYRGLTVTGSPITDLTSITDATVSAGQLQFLGASVGSNANRITTTTQNLSGGGTSFRGGDSFGGNNPGRSVSGGSLNITGGLARALEANAINGGGMILVGGTGTFVTANNVSGGTVAFTGGGVAIEGNAASFSVTNANVGGVNTQFGTLAVTRSNGTITATRSPTVNFGSPNFGITFANGVSNVSIGTALPAGDMFIRAGGGVGHLSGNGGGNLNNILIGNITTQTMQISTTGFGYPVGANVSNYSAGNVTIGGINIFTGTAGNLSSVTGTFTRGNVRLNGKNIVLQADASATGSGTGTFVFDETNTATLGNLVVSNYFSGNGSLLTGINAANANYANFAGNAFAVDGANVSGTVANATFALDAGNANIANVAYSVALANVSGAGNIASINLDGNVSNLLTGNGTFVAIPTSTANANYANFAGTAFSVDGANVSGTVANATFALDAGNANFANSATTANTANSANSVTLANVSGAGNIASINLDGSSSNVLYGNGVFAASSGGNGIPGGANTELQFNANGAFGGISTVTWNGSNLSLGNISNVKVNGGANTDVIRTDGTGNLSFASIAETLLVGTRAGPYTVPITNYTFQVTARTGNVTVYVN